MHFLPTTISFHLFFFRNLSEDYFSAFINIRVYLIIFFVMFLTCVYSVLMTIIIMHRSPVGIALLSVNSDNESEKNVRFGRRISVHTYTYIIYKYLPRRGEKKTRSILIRLLLSAQNWLCTNLPGWATGKNQNPTDDDVGDVSFNK